MEFYRTQIDADQLLPRPKRGRRYLCSAYELMQRLGLYNQVCNGTEKHRQYLCRIPIHIGYLGNTAGWAHYPRAGGRPNGLIELHEELFKSEDRRDELKRTFLHELGHQLDHATRGKSDHSSEFKHCCARLGLPNETRCHSITYLRDRRVTMKCDTPSCGMTEGTTKPETQDGRRCTWCRTGRLRVPREKMAALRFKAEETK